MLTENFRITHADGADTATALLDSNQVESAFDERNKLLEAAGFKARRRLEGRNNENHKRVATAGIVYPEMKDDVLKVWRRFLPTTTLRDNYTYDAVPNEALSEIKSAQDLHCFDRIEIWTPEGNSYLGLMARRLKVAKNKLDQLTAKLDPLAVGIIDSPEGPHFFQIVRWGEALLPFGQIKHHVNFVHRAGNLTVALAVLVILAAATAVIVVPFVFFVWWKVLIGAVVLAAVVGYAGWYMAWW